MNLDDLRNKIDSLDGEIVLLVTDRGICTISDDGVKELVVLKARHDQTKLIEVIISEN